MLRLAIALMVGLAPAIARADRYEASLAAEVHGCLARVGERGTDAKWVPAVGLGGRLSHAWTNYLAWDVGLEATLMQPATFPDAEAVVDDRPERGAITRRTVTGRAEVGAELRLGARVIPTVRLGLGPQVRYRSASDLGTFVDAIPATVSLDAVVSLGVGLDVRPNRHRGIRRLRPAGPRAAAYFTDDDHRNQRIAIAETG